MAPRIGFKHSDETKARMREAANAHWAKPGSRERVSERLRGRKRGPMSQEQREKLRAILLGRKQSPEITAKVAAANRGLKRSPETKAKISAARRGTKMGPMSPEQRAKIALGMTGHTHAPESRAAYREGYVIRERRRESPVELDVKAILDALGVDYIWQYPIEDANREYVVDFFIPARRLVLEVDSRWNSAGSNKERNKTRDEILRKLGYTVIHLQCRDLINNADALICDALNIDALRLAKLGVLDAVGRDS
jgi:very-short-patch-repair endonuclease